MTKIEEKAEITHFLQLKKSKYRKKCRYRDRSGNFGKTCYQTIIFALFWMKSILNQRNDENRRKSWNHSFFTMESDMTSKKEYLIFWKTLFRKTKILFSDWIKMIYYFILLFLYVFTHLPSLSRRESNLVSTSYHPDVIIKYISLSLLRSCFVLR